MALLISSQVTLMQWSGHWYVSYLPLHISFHEFLPKGTDISLKIYYLMYMHCTFIARIPKP